ncbi:MAG: hypothetical protein SGJ10_10230 [Bacteroidota bacterium]|nr:hypothetical protein [Bacteroidota bacterium]
MSKKITWPEAQLCIQDYLANVTTPIQDNLSNTIKGYRIDANHVLDILGVVGVPKVKDIFIVFGVSPLDLSSTGHKTITTIVTGIDALDNITTNKVYDMCIPCPTGCPKGF